MVVVDGDGLEAVGLAVAAQGDNAVARIRRALLGDMRRRRGIVIGRAPDAARIEDDGTIGDADQFRAVAVAAQRDAASRLEMKPAIGAR